MQNSVENYSQNDTNAQKKLVAFYKFFSPENLLNKPFANDSNTLDKGFYEELLYIIGLEEITEGNKKLIVRCSPQNRFDGSLIESAIYQLEEKYRSEEICFEAALRLSIVWVNRLLFLKLLESTQLVYQSGNPDYKFLTSEFIPDYDILNELFFKVLAKRPEERNSSIKEKYKFVPYLNSSLFEVSEEEENSGLQIRGLKSCLMPVFKRTVLKKDGRRSTEELDTLEYIFRFLDSYNFASDGSQQVQEENKTLINASVLGLIFEKINGYKDGSFFTPGYITQYMAHEALERAVVEKFNNVKKWKCKNLIDVKNEIEDRAEAERIFDSIHICDPAVG